MKINLVILTLVIIFSASCSKFSKIKKSTDLNLKYDAAVAYYKDKDYGRALELFEELLPIYKGTKKGEEVHYYYSFCNYGLEDFILAGYYFRNFINTYPNSKYAEELKFMGAYCYYLDSPKPDLDQANTMMAIEEFQAFSSKYPKSAKVQECNELIDVLREKLARKSYNSAKLYYRLSEYKSAIIALKNSLKDYPNTKYKEDLMFMILESSYMLAKNSIESKQKERYEDTIKEYYTFIGAFPESRYLKKAEKMYKSAQEAKKSTKNS